MSVRKKKKDTSDTFTVSITSLPDVVIFFSSHDNEVIGRSPPGSGASSGGSSSGADESWLGYLNTMMSSASASILPTQVTDTLLQGRAFATVHHNQPGMKNICALAVLVTLDDMHWSNLHKYSRNLDT